MGRGRGPDAVFLTKTMIFLLVSYVVQQQPRFSWCFLLFFTNNLHLSMVFLFFSTNMWQPSRDCVFFEGKRASVTLNLGGRGKGSGNFTGVKSF